MENSRWILGCKTIYITLFCRNCFFFFYHCFLWTFCFIFIHLQCWGQPFTVVSYLLPPVSLVRHPISPRALFCVTPHHFTPATQLPGTTATLSGLIMSFLLMVPEAASPSGPPSSRMSRTSAPVAIAPKGWGSAPRSRVSAWRGTRLRSGGGATSAPSGGGVRRRAARTRLAQGQVGIPPVSRHLSLPNGPRCLLSLSASTSKLPGCGPAAPLPTIDAIQTALPK